MFRPYSGEIEGGFDVAMPLSGSYNVHSGAGHWCNRPRDIRTD